MKKRGIIASNIQKKKMGTPHSPRKGSLQVWPRKRAKRIYPKVRTWPNIKDKILGFAGYKVGMCHVILPDNRKNSPTKNELISWPATIVECPPIKVFGVRFYSSDSYGLHPKKDVLLSFPKELSRKLVKPKKINDKALDSIKTDDYSHVALLVMTQPSSTTLGKKKPEVFEIMYGSKDISKIKELAGKDITVDQVISEGDLIDVHAVTRGKGLQGPTKRFGLALRHHKSEKTKRGPGTLGPWHPAKVMFMVPHAGQMGYHARTDYNKQVLKIAKPEELQKSGGHINYGVIKNTCIIIKGSIPGSKKRLVRFNAAIRPNKKLSELVPQVNQIILEK